MFPRTNYPGTIFPGTNFPGTNLPGTNFPGTIFPGTIFPGTIFPETHFPGTIFPRTLFPGDHFSGDQFSWALFFRGPFFLGTIFPRTVLICEWNSRDSRFDASTRIKKSLKAISHYWFYETVTCCYKRETVTIAFISSKHYVRMSRSRALKKKVYWINKIGVSRVATVICYQLNTIRNWINYFIDWKQKHNNKMHPLNYVQCSLNKIWEWHPTTTKFVDSTNFFFQCVYMFLHWCVYLHCKNSGVVMWVNSTHTCVVAGIW